MSFLANRNVRIFNSTMSVSTLNTSAMAISTLTGSSLTASTINASTLNTSATNFSTLTGSTLTASTISVSTLNTSNANFSTLTGSTLTASSIIGSTLSISTLTGSTLTASRIGYSTLSGSSIISNDLVLSTLTVSSINSGAPGVGAYSTFNASSINVNSTLTASTINGSTINLSTLNTSNANVSTLTGSTLSVSTMTGSTLTISRLTGLIISASTISASSITSNDLTLSTLTVSSINGLPPGAGGSGGSGGTTIFSTLGVSSLNANSTITTSTLIANSYVGIGSTAINGKLSVNAGATNNLALSLTSAGPGWGSGMQLINNTATTGRNYGIYAGAGGTFNFVDSTAGVDRVLINSVGNVGIGTNAPGHLLDVNGTLNVRGSFTVNGTAVATGTGSVWTVGASNAIYYSAGNTCLYRNRLIFSNAINDFNHSIYNNYGNLDSEGGWDGMKFNVYAGGWFRTGNVGGTTAMFMNTSGQIGIGTTGTQGNALMVWGGNSVSGISLGDYNTTAVKYIGITVLNSGTTIDANTGFSGITFGPPNDGGTEGYLAFHTHDYGVDSGEKMRIDKRGRVGIGKNNPSQLLDVNGAINCTSFLVNGTAVATGTGSVWGVNGSSAYYTSGNVGISTTAPNTNLHVRVPTWTSPVLIVDAGGQGADLTPPRGIGKPLIGVGANSWSNVSSGDYYGIGFGYIGSNVSGLYYAGEIGFLVQSTSGGELGDLVFSTRPTTTHTSIATERMRITSTGNVGIGTTSVSYPLDLYSSSAILARFQNPGEYARIVLDGATGTGGDLIFKAGGVSKYGIACISGKLQFLLNDSTGTIPMTLDTSGNIGIGTATPAYPLTLKTSANTSGMTHTDGTIIVGSYVGGSVTAGWYGTTSNHPLCFFTNNSAASMTINTSSQVGIGTVTPSYKLHVYTTTANDGILFQNAFNGSTGSIALFTSTAAGNFILDGTADAGIILPTGGKDLFLNRTTSLYTSMVIKGGTGNVGIGTATPAYLTSISSSGFINLEINRTGAGTNYGAGIIHSLTSSTGSFRGEYAFAFGGATTIATSAQTQAYGYYGVDLANAGVFATNSVGYTGSYFFINTSSACFPRTNVGIGKTNPNISYALDVAGSINCTSFLVNGTAVATGTGSVWGVNGSSAYYTSGNVGIGTNAPGAKLSVIPVDGTTNYGLLSFVNSSGYGIFVNTTSIGSRGNTLDWYTYDYNFGSITTRPILTMRPEGNIGIGTTLPATALHIARSVSANSDYSLMTYYENTTPAYHDWAIGPYVDNNAAAFAVRSASNNLPANLVNLFFIDGYGTALRFPQYTTSGTLSINGSGGAISSSSDRRIKQDIVYQTDTSDALARVLQLRPATFRYLEQDSVHLGFIAQDVEQCIPLAVDGKKYEWQWIPTENGAPTFDAEGNMLYQTDKDGNRIIRPRGLEDRAILAMQTLAIQQLAAENSQLKSQMSSLLAWAQTQGFSG